MALEAQKDALRRAVLTARASVSPEAWADEDRRRTEHLLALLNGGPPHTVALYASRPGEPSTTAAIDALHDAGWPLLLPVLRRHPDWARFDGWAHTTPSWGDIPEPTTPRLGAEGLATADLIVISCLAVGRDRSRLGTGGGWYDRALEHRRADAPVIALTREAEVYDTIPMESHDLIIDGYVTEAGSVLFND
ncbi:MAG TPA: 5-formyltetrahydrofolate cyclo-ligase [Tessaracoccus flavescens]|uniref:5-formyltetrahydrofolate cyclo-ligase n=1 Tax=Tessaracoccus flavescens TaxID=399497 RepID=A0A921EMH3_9ACTN|nr:5-formyltetrahydrofolate cyclo-ligase [Tessaracoccus flavescens]